MNRGFRGLGKSRGRFQPGRFGSNNFFKKRVNRTYGMGNQPNIINRPKMYNVSIFEVSTVFNEIFTHPTLDGLVEALKVKNIVVTKSQLQKCIKDKTRHPLGFVVVNKTLQLTHTEYNELSGLDAMIRTVPRTSNRFLQLQCERASLIARLNLMKSKSNHRLSLMKEGFQGSQVDNLMSQGLDGPDMRRLKSWGAMLDDPHADAGQKLMHSLGYVGGQRVLSNQGSIPGFEYQKCDDPSFQIHHCVDQQHWVGTVYLDGYIYYMDSLQNGKPNRHIIEMLKKCYNLRDNKVIVIPTYPQSGGSNLCLLYALANCLELLKSRNPQLLCHIKWNDRKMRNHYQKCLCVKKISSFPHQIDQNPCGGGKFEEISF